MSLSTFIGSDNKLLQLCFHSLWIYMTASVPHITIKLNSLLELDWMLNIQYLWMRIINFINC